MTAQLCVSVSSTTYSLSQPESIHIKLITTEHSHKMPFITDWPICVHADHVVTLYLYTDIQTLTTDESTSDVLEDCNLNNLN